MTITATLLSPIAASFSAAHHASWVGTSFLLANITFTPLFGRLSDILGRRTSNSLAISLFTAGTLACAVAPNMWSFILFRFLAGSGGGGLSVTSAVITSDLFSLKQRGLVGGVQTGLWAVGGALGGPIGGLISDTLGWRAAFLVQVPLLVLALVSGLTHINYHPIAADSAAGPTATAREKLARIDFWGCGTLFLTFGSFLLSLSLRNNSNLPWSNPWVITTTAAAPVFLAAFAYVEARVAVEPILPFRLIARRTPLFGNLLTIFVAVANFGLMYSFPLFFLAVEGKTSREAGAHLLPNSVGHVTGGLLAGLVLFKTGLYRVPASIVGVLIFVGPVLISRLTPASPQWLQWLAVLPQGIGQGYVLNSGFVALQANCARAEIPQIVGVQWLFRSTGQVVGVATTSAILQAVLTSALRARITGPDAAHLIERIRSDTGAIAGLPEGVQELARESYAVAIRWVFRFVAGMAFLAWLSMTFIPQAEVEGAKPVRAKVDGAGAEEERQARAE